MEYDEFGNPLFEEELSDDEEESQGSVASPTRLQEDQQPLSDFDDQDQQGAMEVDGQSSTLLTLSLYSQGKGLERDSLDGGGNFTPFEQQRGEGGYTRELSISKRAK